MANDPGGEGRGDLFGRGVAIGGDGDLRIGRESRYGEGNATAREAAGRVPRVLNI
jgi:hypothetical protein